MIEKVTEKLEETAMVQFMSRFDENPFLLRFQGREYRIGEGEPAFTVDFKKAIPVAELKNSTSIALGEAYMNGEIEIEGDLYQALDHFLGQMGKFSTDEHALKKLIYSSVSKKNQKEEVTSHYDIGNDFYKLWLDETMSYSCAYFKSENDSLYRAQMNKIEYILQKLYLQEGMTLLDIGCGWGCLLIEAAKKYKIRGKGITLSTEQYKEFQKRIQEENLEGQLSVELMDYRDLPSPLYQCAERTSGRRMDQKIHFPGGMIPSLREMTYALAEKNFHVQDMENLRMHYNQTLLCWEKNFREHLDEVREMFDERFVRMWDLYLSACAATFHNGIIDLHQILAVKGINNELPMVRWY